MFDTLTDKLGGILDKLKGRGVLSEDDVNVAMREIRIALLEADVALPVVKDFIEKVRVQALGQEVIKSITPGQMVAKIVHDALLETLGGVNDDLDLNAEPPVVVLMLGLQGSGKTTTTGKLAKYLKDKKRKKVLLASLDVYRPAAQEQLSLLAENINIDALPVIAGEKPIEITKRALKEAKLGGYDVLMLDTAGRNHIDEVMMQEASEIKKIANPKEALLVVDALTGQDAVNIAKDFEEKIGITGIILTRIDGDSRGGAALSVRFITGKPLKFLGVGEKLEDLEAFHPDRLAGRILGMGDVVSLVEQTIEKIDKDDAEKMAERMMKGQFNLEDMLSQIKQIKKMGDLKGILGMIPGIAKIKKQIDQANLDNSIVNRQEAIILSMTIKERKHPEIIKASRKKRIAAGSGTSVQDVNKLLKQYEQMAEMMKKMKKMGGLSSIMSGGGIPSLDALLPKGGLRGPNGGGFPPFGNFRP